MRPLSILALVVLSSLAGCAPEQPTATLAVTGAHIWTGDDEQPWAEAMAIDGERILAVGSDTDIAPYITATTELIDGGALITPGFIDTHVHFLDGGEANGSWAAPGITRAGEASYRRATGWTT